MTSFFLRFFAWADHNRMPIKDIIVDWGNRRPRAGNNEGKYKNRKPYCQVDNATPSFSCNSNRNITCVSDADSAWCKQAANNPQAVCNLAGPLFGSSPDACDPGYYEFIGAYAFDSTDTGTQGKCRYTIGGRSPDGIPAADLTKLTRDYGLRAGDRYCAFKPRVIIIDNWGWCNGGAGGNQDVGGCKANNGGCWGNPEDQRENICVKQNSAEYQGGLVGTKFNGWVIVAEQK